MKIIKDRSGIISLLTVLAVGFFAVGTALTLVTGALLELAKNQNTTLGDQAFYTAESGAQEAAYQYMNATTTYTGSSTPPFTSNGVTTSSIVLKKDFPSWPYVLVQGTAGNRLTSRVVDWTITVFPEGDAFKYGMFGTGDIDFSGGGQINGNVFSGGNITLGPSSAGIDGDAFANGTIFIGSSLVTGLVVQNVSSSFPAPQIDDAPYKAMAAAAGTLFTDANGAESFLKNSTHSGVVYVSSTQDVNIQKAVLNGTLVTLGNLTLTGNNAAYNAVTSTQPVLIVRKELSVGSGIVINGVIFVKSKTDLGAGTTINGTVISEGLISSSGGGATINFDPNIFASWKDILGLGTSTTSSTPKIVLWGEE